MRTTLCVVASLAMLLAGCQQPQQPVASSKNMLAKYQDISGETQSAAKALHAMKATAAPTPTAVPVPSSTTTWKDSNGTQYTLQTNQTLTYIPAPVVVPPPPPPPPPSPIPANAISSGPLLPGPWKQQYDPGTPGSASGTTTYPVAGGVTGNTARQYNMTYTGKGGELFHVSFGPDQTATHFVYDTYVMFPDVSQLQNVELDMNQVVANGNTVILATQCASGSKSWEYTVNGHWAASTIPCNPQSWAPNVWHHIQIATHHDASGVVTYDWVAVDGVSKNFPATATGPESHALHWGNVLLINFQLDGLLASGSITAKMDNTVVYRW